MFIGRKKELAILEAHTQSDRFEFGLIYGRRRVGKTRLLQKIAQVDHAIYFVANEMGLDYNLGQLTALVASYYGEPISFDSFDQLLQYLAIKAKDEKLILIIDEFSYLISTNPEILSIIQNSIDQHLIDSKVKLILSGSHVGMIEDAFSYKKPLYGRTSFKLKIEPFDYYDASLFYPGLGAQDKVRLFSIFGGIPFYTQRIDDSRSVKENVLDLLIKEGAAFEDEVAFFLSQEVRSMESYGRILNAIASGATRNHDISTKAHIRNSGNTSKYLSTLITLDIVEREFPFGEGIHSKRSLYRIKDPMFRFHYRFIENKRSQKTIMEADRFYDIFIEPYLDDFISQAFERICRDYLVRQYKDSIQEIGRYWYHSRAESKEIEIDIIMREDDGLSAYECKWSKRPIDGQVLSQLKEKADLLDIKRLGFFSRSGFSPSMPKEAYRLFDAEALYRMDQSEQ